MLRELRVENLGLIDDLRIEVPPGMTAITGETGTGKTLVVEAIELLLGARADAALVRSGASETRVEARFEVSGDQTGGDSQRALATVLDEAGLPWDGELVLSRIVPAEGRSRGHCNGRPVTASFLAGLAPHLVDLHGQHAQHSLLTPAAQRLALDHFAGAGAAEALAEYRSARAALERLDARLDDLGGDEGARLREADLLAFQVEEIDDAGITDPGEDLALRDEEERLADTGAIRELLDGVHADLAGAASETVGRAVDGLRSKPSLARLAERLALVQDELDSVTRAVREESESVEGDPERLGEVSARRRRLGELRKKYGDTLEDVLRHRDEAGGRLADLQAAADGAAAIEAERTVQLDRALDAAAALGDVRRGACERLGVELRAVLSELAMPAARLEVRVESRERPAAGGRAVTWSDLPADGLDDVEFLFSANEGEALKPLARVVSGGELARTMLAARVVLTAAPPTLVFDEVDAGIGGEAGVAVGRKLGLVAREHQVICVTHLAQVAAFADHHLVVEKRSDGGRTIAEARSVDGAGRVAELSRMLAGSGTEAALDHAEELLAGASAERAG